MNEHLNQYVEAGRMSVRQKAVNGFTYNIYCYTKDQFFNHDWDLTTITHRGTIYGEDGKRVNRPFEKIFNMGEHHSTRRDRIDLMLTCEPFEVLDKLNGHLTIVSPDLKRGVVLVSTKGSFEGDLAEKDNLLVIERGIDKTILEKSLNYTMMFECIADYDKHLWYYEQVQRYTNDGENTLVLLGAIDNVTGDSMHYEALLELAGTLGTPITQRFPDLEQHVSIDDMYEHRDIEGYVLHFPKVNFRFKVKTKQYVALHYMKEITPERLVNKLFDSGHENMYAELDEEVYPILDAMMFDLEQFFFQLVDLDIVNEVFKRCSREQVVKADILTPLEKAYVFELFKGCDPKKLMHNKKIREQFKASNDFPATSRAVKRMFEESLYNDKVTA